MAEHHSETELFRASFKEINRLLIAYAEGNYTRRGRISNRLDAVDTVINGINMLGEELRVSTISSDYFTSIFNAVPDMIFVLSPRGTLKSFNTAAQRTLGIQVDETDRLPAFAKTAGIDSPGFLRTMKKSLERSSSYTCESSFMAADKKVIPVWCLCTKIIDQKNDFKGYLLVARDITSQKESEKIILRAILDTQEKEQQRVAEDLHDSLGQELSALKLYLNTLENIAVKNDKKVKEVLDQCYGLLDSSIQNLRSICFNLLPGTIELSGLAEAIEALIYNLNLQKKVRIIFEKPRRTEEIPKPIELALYRIIQEFINNTIKHAQATEIVIRLQFNSAYDLYLSDNGKGFNLDTTQPLNGHGLNNMRSRVRMFQGSFELSSAPGKGTQVTIKIPKN